MPDTEAMAERARILAFMREGMENPPAAIPPEIVEATRIIVNTIAAAIERGVHDCIAIPRLSGDQGAK